MGRTRTSLDANKKHPAGEDRDKKRQRALLTWIEKFAPYGVITLDESLQVQSWNHWMEMASGKRFADVAGKKLFDLFPDLRKRRVAGQFDRALQGESSVLSTALHSFLLPLPSSYREFSSKHMLQTARIAPLFFEEKVCGLVIVIEDVTQREGQADALARQHRRDLLLSWALAHLLNTEEPRRAVRQLFFKIAEHLDFDTFLVYFRDLETGNLVLDTWGGLPVESEKDFRACPFSAFMPPDSAKPALLNSVKNRTEPEYGVLKKAGISAAIALPLFGKQQSLGLLCFGTWSRDAIAPDEVELIATIAQYLATALDREKTNRQLNKAQEELSHHAQLLEVRVQERTSRLQETIGELETLSYTMAHDLRAPARAMNGYCDVLLEDFAEGLSEDAKRMVVRIARASRRMESLTRDLLEFSKVSHQEIALSRVEIEPIIEDVLSLRTPAVRQAVSVRTPLHAVYAHPGLLQHVFLNLVDNAVKFVQPQAAPRISIFTETVIQSSPSTRSGELVFSASEPDSAEAAGEPSEPAANHIRIWVNDEGIGIAPEVHPKIFGIFERGVPADLYEGTGMGLAIVARAMQRMGGRCGVESEPGKGSRFWLELPVA